jgi:polyphenol oxidase
MNLGDHVGDAPECVQSNRLLLQNALGCRPVFLRQTHGDQVVLLQTQSVDGIPADACLTVQAGVACTIMVADCLPVLMCDVSGRWVAAAHAGWRGLSGKGGVGVLEGLLQQAVVHNTPVQDILVWLGPCIGPQAFEVGPEVKAAFCATDPLAADFFKPCVGHQWRADLAALARWRLSRQGILHVFGNDGHAAWCTVTQSSRFFSHRRDSPVFGQSGRMAACIWLTR